MQLIKHISNFIKQQTQWYGLCDLHHLLVTKDIELRELHAAIHLHRGVPLVPSIPANRRLQRVQNYKEFRVTKSSELQRVQSYKEFRVTKSSEDSKSLQVTPKVKTLKASLLEVGHGIAKALYLHCTNLNKSSTFLTMGRCRQRNFIPLPLSPRLLDDNYNVFISYWGKDLWRN